LHNRRNKKRASQSATELPTLAVIALRKKAISWRAITRLNPFAASRFSLVVVSRPQTGSIYLIAVHIGIHSVGRL
jgi:hypothetical protein